MNENLHTFNTLGFWYSSARTNHSEQCVVLMKILKFLPRASLLINKWTFPTAVVAIAPRTTSRLEILTSAPTLDHWCTNFRYTAETPFFSWGGDCLTAYFSYNRANPPKARSSHPAGTRETKRFTIFNPYPYFYFCLHTFVDCFLQFNHFAAPMCARWYGGDVNKSGKITLE